eukprot:948800-Alexandrium_andersonii.AAC.1
MSRAETRARAGPRGCTVAGAGAGAGARAMAGAGASGLPVSCRLSLSTCTGLLGQLPLPMRIELGNATMMPWDPKEASYACDVDD